MNLTVDTRNPSPGRSPVMQLQFDDDPTPPRHTYQPSTRFQPKSLPPPYHLPAVPPPPPSVHPRDGSKPLPKANEHDMLERGKRGMHGI
jgi:hypothetical protein